jgi:Holliday junction resolvase
MKEAEIERKLVKAVERMGGLAFKFVSPGACGVPDRLLVMPGGRVYFVELKTQIGRLSKIQTYRLKQLCDRGQNVEVIKGEEALKAFVAKLDAGGGV